MNPVIGKKMVPKRIQIAVLIVLVVVAAFVIAAIWQSAADRVLAEGEFHSVAHRGQGTVKIVVRDGRRYLQIADFRTYHRPGLEVLLISSPDAFENETVKNAERYTVGALKDDEGAMEYELPTNLDISRFNAVTVWSSRYESNFTTAPLRKTVEDEK
ncbi:MAG: DM13 domain-containing protein [Acidobacteria bacterium]|nr:DM13 domain-containing protein [Acidobacteriota bacterium]